MSRSAANQWQKPIAFSSEHCIDVEWIFQPYDHPKPAIQQL